MPDKEDLITIFKMFPMFMLPVNFCTFGENHVILLQTVAK